MSPMISSVSMASCVLCIRYSRLCCMLLLLLLSACRRDLAPTHELSAITIYRDAWGVPHIHAPTDQEVAYGLAWAQCEDDFITLQEQMLAIQGKLGQLKGKDGVILDFAIQYMGIRERALAAYDDIDPKVQQIMEYFASGINTYATCHPESVLLEQGFPITPQDILAGNLLGLVEISGAGEDLRRIIDQSITKEEIANFPKGSNAIAIAAKRTATGETFLAINSHQPMEGWYSWYEAHLISDEGQNILGGTFPGGTTIFHGSNEHLGWAHTVNHADFSDVYRLEMHPTEPLTYAIDGGYKKLKEKKYRNWVRLWGPLKIPVSRTIYESELGITFETDGGYYAWRYVASDATKSIQQWYRMNRAIDLATFRAALEIQGIPCTNIVYADANDNIYYISNGKIPIRERDYNWREVLPGTISALTWDEGYWPLDSLPQLLNPSSGYVFNTNNTPFHCSDTLDNPPYYQRYKTMGYLEPHHNNNRSMRLSHLLGQDTSITYQEFKTIKYDRQYPPTLIQPAIMNQELIMQLDSISYPNISDAIRVIQKWNRRTDKDNLQAALVILACQFLSDDLRERDLLKRGNRVTEAQCADAIAAAQSYMMEHYQQLEIPLGVIQRHRRGEIDLPLGGGPDVIAAIYSRQDKDHKWKAHTGESYIQLVRFKKGELPRIETINAYGSSANPQDPHATDQMSLFASGQLKPMSLSLEVIKKSAKRHYHPLGR